MATYAIVHGAADVASSWDLVAHALRERGHDVVAVDLPSEDESAGFPEYADTVVEAIGDRTDVVVVAHSLGGFTAPLVADRVGADLLVLVAGMVPAPGEKAADWWSASGYERAVEEAGGLPEDPIELFMHDVPTDLAARAMAAERGQAETPMLRPWPLDVWPDVPTRYLLARDDRFFPAAFVRTMVRARLGIVADEIDGSHCVYLSRPRELAERLEGLRSERSAPVAGAAHDGR